MSTHRPLLPDGHVDRCRLLALWTNHPVARLLRLHARSWQRPVHAADRSRTIRGKNAVSSRADDGDLPRGRPRHRQEWRRPSPVSAIHPFPDLAGGPAVECFTGRTREGLPSRSERCTGPTGTGGDDGPILTASLGRGSLDPQPPGRNCSLEGQSRDPLRLRRLLGDGLGLKQQLRHIAACVIERCQRHEPHHRIAG